MKEMHRLLMTSTVLPAPSRRDPAYDAVDAANSLFGRFSVARLDGETFRDRLLTASGRLSTIAYGRLCLIVEDAVGRGTP